LKQQHGDCCNNDSTSEGQQIAWNARTISVRWVILSAWLAGPPDCADSTASVASNYDHVLQFLGLGGDTVPFGKYWRRCGTSGVSNNWSSDTNNVNESKSANRGRDIASC